MNMILFSHVRVLISLLFELILFLLKMLINLLQLLLVLAVPLCVLPALIHQLLHDFLHLRLFVGVFQVINVLVGECARVLVEGGVEARVADAARPVLIDDEALESALCKGAQVELHLWSGLEALARAL